MKICAYVQEQYAKQTYKNESFDTRQFAGLRVILDVLQRGGYDVEYASSATVHNYDVVLVSITSDCDWWSFTNERMSWQRGNYKVCIGGAGVLHVTPWLSAGDYFMLGRGENTVLPLVQAIERGDDFEHESVINARTFSPDRIYRIAQAVHPYPHVVELSKGKRFNEGAIGCNHKCLFCGYTWQREFSSNISDSYKMSDSLFGGIEGKELALLDLKREGTIDFTHLRTTAIDGFSERLRYMINKRISNDALDWFLAAMVESEAKPHQIKLYNICGYPTETVDDWRELLERFRTTEQLTNKHGKQWSIVLHTTPFRAMPATPMACAPMSKRNYRGEFGRVLGEGLKGGLIYQGKNLWAVESMGTDSLATVMLSAIAHRGSAGDQENIGRLCRTKKFWSAPSAVKEATLEKYFDLDTLFGTYSPETLPSRYLRTYLPVENAWGRVWGKCYEE